MILKAIAAMSQNRVIGKNNQLPWRIPEELEWFKRMTLDNIIIMGRKTFDGMNRRVLPKRQTIILTSSTDPLPNVTVIHELHDILCIENPEDKIIWICGGAQIYQQLLPYCSELMLTIVKRDIEGGDAFFPELPPSFELSETILQADQFDILHYINKKKEHLSTLLTKKSVKH